MISKLSASEISPTKLKVISPFLSIILVLSKLLFDKSFNTFSELPVKSMPHVITISIIFIACIYIF